jgi:hypothetical protein
MLIITDVLFTRVSSKQSKFFFGSNQNKPKLNLFQLFFGLFRETKKHFFSVCFGLFRFVSLFRTCVEKNETNRILSKQTKKSPKTVSIMGVLKTVNFFLGSNRNKPKLNLFQLFFGLVFCETKKFFCSLFRCFGLVSKQPKQTELLV